MRADLQKSVMFMTAFFNKKWLITGVLWLLLIPALVLVRHRSGSHYLPVAVQFTEELLQYGNDVQVHVISPFGTSRLLTRDAYDRLVFRSPDYFGGAVQYITVSGVKPGFIADVKLRVIPGTSRLSLSASCPVILKPAAFEAVSGVVKGPMAVYGADSDSSSLLKTPGKCLNWQGDVCLITLCAIQAGALILWLKALAELYRRWSAHGVVKVNSSIHGSVNVPGLWFLKRVTLLVVMLLLGHQFWVQLLQLYAIPDAIEQMVGLCFVGGAGVLVWRGAGGKVVPESSACSRRVVVCAVLLLLLLVRCVVSGGWPWYQTGDYATYWHLGGRMAAGEWREINDGFHLTRLLALRAAVYAYPVRLLAGDSGVIFALFNHACLLGAASVLYLFVQKSWGARAGFITAALFSLHPDILFGGHLCRHDNPAMLYLAIVSWLLYELCSGLSSAPWHWGQATRLSLLCFVAGGLMGVLDIQRSYLPVLILASFLCLALTMVGGLGCFAGAGDCGIQSVWKSFFCLLLFCVLCLTSLFVRNTITNAVLAQTGDMPGRSISQVLISLETASDQVWQDFQPFLRDYADQIPPDLRNKFLLRKMLLEKVRSGAEFWRSLVRKNATLSSLRSAVGMSGGVRQGETFPSVFNVPYAGMKFTWAGGLYCCLLSLAMLRVILIKRIPFVLLEVFPVVFSLVGVVAILVFTETAEQYDIFLALPLAITAARVLAVSGAGHTAPVAVATTLDSIRSSAGKWTGPVVSTAVLVAILVGMHLSGATLLGRHPEWTFAEAKLLESNSGPGGVDTGRFANAVFPVEGDSLAAGVIAKADFTVAASDLSTDRLRFFISRDQRRQRAWDSIPEVDLPIWYCVSVDGDVVSEGQLGDLEPALFIQHPLRKGGGLHRIELLMTTTREISSEELTATPRLAIEYVH